MAGPTVMRASVEELRQQFNQNYLAKTLDGTFLHRDFGPQSPYQNPSDKDPSQWEPDGTTKGLIEIIDRTTNTRVAVAHRLRRPDGTFGASGLPDPKMVFLDGVIYLQKRKEGRKPEDLKTPSLFAESGSPVEPEQ
jgi:hypothetical protein